MTKKLLLTLVLATGVALAQTGSGGTGNQGTQTPSGSAASPTGTNDQTSPQQQQTTPGSTQTTPGSTQTTPGSNQSTTSTSGANSSESTIRGCLKQSGGDWILSQSGSGQSVTLKGD